VAVTAGHGAAHAWEHGENTGVHASVTGEGGGLAADGRSSTAEADGEGAMQMRTGRTAARVTSLAALRGTGEAGASSHGAQASVRLVVGRGTARAGYNRSTAGAHAGFRIGR
jgi:hypothetical protein